MKDSSGILLLAIGGVVAYFLWSRSQSAVTVGTQASPVLPAGYQPVPLDTNAGPIAPQGPTLGGSASVVCPGGGFTVAGLCVPLTDTSPVTDYSWAPAGYQPLHLETGA